MKAKDVIGQRVIASDGSSVGEVVDLLITDDWKVEYLVVRLERDVAKAVGFRFSIRPKGLVPVSLVRGFKDYITLGAEGEELYRQIRKAD